MSNSGTGGTAKLSSSVNRERKPSAAMLSTLQTRTTPEPIEDPLSLSELR
jgi:hypothetical protein